MLSFSNSTRRSRIARACGGLERDLEEGSSPASPASPTMASPTMASALKGTSLLLIQRHWLHPGESSVWQQLDEALGRFIL
ncbi:hypothetical protein PAPYR_9176 [Paratrimastix pyriformis]|uniref:Uncharacterized protein n=1 Tax=Paratrimastix pyriformis TaxID=342808 RepID=A0ABQ8UAN4_9EUKA|nr:hypothetical protein PAPYR_9176 [Paratrimastix pyriformis]